MRNSNIPPAAAQGSGAIVIEEFDDPSTLNFLADSDALHQGLTGFHKESFVSAIRLITDGIEMPAELFEAFCQHLMVNAGTLMFLDNDSRMFAPWVSKGMDKTSQHRLRFPLDFLQSYFADTKDPVLIEDEKK